MYRAKRDALSYRLKQSVIIEGQSDSGETSSPWTRDDNCGVKQLFRTACATIGIKNLRIRRLRHPYVSPTFSERVHTTAMDKTVQQRGRLSWQKLQPRSNCSPVARQH